MSEVAQDERKPKPLGNLLFDSFVTFNLGPVVDQTVRWSDHLAGLMNGLFHVMIYGIAWCMYLLPWSLAVCALYRWRKWKRFRTHWVLAPAVLLLIVTIGSLITHPPTPSNRFKGFAKTELPKEIRNLQYRFSGGGIADYSDTYYFETSPAEVDRLIAEMKLKEDPNYDRERRLSTSVRRLPNGPDFAEWTEAKQYCAQDDETGWYYYLITDASRTQVYVLIGCI